METCFHVHRRRTDGMRQKYFRDAYAASRCYDDRSTPRTDHMMLRRMARGLRNDGLSRRVETDERVTTLFTKKKSSQEHVRAVSRTEPVP